MLIKTVDIGIYSDIISGQYLVSVAAFIEALFIHQISEKAKSGDRRAIMRNNRFISKNVVPMG